MGCKRCVDGDVDWEEINEELKKRKVENERRKNY
jgi:hypothetical protein